MNRSELAGFNMARKCFWSSNTDGAFSNYLELFNANPKSWWLAMEAIRCKRVLTPDVRREKLILFSPNYSGNSYQKNLYAKHEYFDYLISPVNKLQLDVDLARATYSRHLVFHQHWLKELYWTAPSIAVGIHAIDRHVGILKAIKAFGATICWTLHNLIDHDANACQEELSNYAVREMAKVSDYIFIHTRGAGELLSSHCGLNISEKYRLLEHPLYNDIQQSATPCLPIEIKHEKLNGRRIFLFLGMIRPYKGVEDLLKAFSQVAQANPHLGMHLIIAGHMEDPKVVAALQDLDQTIRDRITLIARRLDENEMAGLIEVADVLVTPYRKILTSGSFYFATTYKKPTIAPSIGMFSEIAKDGETAFLYDGTLDSLSKKLLDVSLLSPEILKAVGANAWKAHQHLTIEQISNRFFAALEAER